MKKVFITAAIILTVFTTAKAQEMKVDFDSGKSNAFTFSQAAANYSVPATSARISTWEDEDPFGGPSNVFIKGNKCTGSDCETCACSSSCNTKTCGKKSVPTKAIQPPDLAGLDKLIAGLSQVAKEKFYKELMFSNGKLASIYIGDIENTLGKEQLIKVLKFFNLKTGTHTRQNENGEDENGDGVIDSDYVRNAKCDGNHNCEPTAATNCTENC